MFRYLKNTWDQSTKKQKGYIVVGLVLAVTFITGVFFAGRATNNPEDTLGDTTNQSGPNVAAVSGAIGQPLKDGNFEFTAHSVKCGIAQVVQPDNDYLHKTAQGQYCVLSLSVKNVGDQEVPYYSRNQKLWDATPSQYGSDEAATTYYTLSSHPSNLANLNPGNSVDVSVVFDIPKGVTPVSAELHESALSAGAKVSLK